MVHIKPEPVDADIVESSRKRKRVRRTKTEIQIDIDKYHQLINNNTDLDKDIPPRRFNIKSEPAPDYIVPVRQTRSKAKQQEEPIEVEEEPKKIKTIKRPRYTCKPTQPQFKKTSSIQKNDTAPQSIDKISHFDSFEHQVMLQNSYSDLIKIVNSNISVKNPEESTIDISLHHKLLPKRIILEMLKFEIPIDLYNNDHKTNPLINTSIFNSGDIDLFFDNLNGGGNTQEMIKDSLKRSVPLI
jgi:hypothetical protein